MSKLVCKTWKFNVLNGKVDGYGTIQLPSKRLSFPELENIENSIAFCKGFEYKLSALRYIGRLGYGVNSYIRNNTGSDPFIEVTAWLSLLNSELPAGSINPLPLEADSYFEALVFAYGS